METTVGTSRLRKWVDDNDEIDPLSYPSVPVTMTIT